MGDSPYVFLRNQRTGTHSSSWFVVIETSVELDDRFVTSPTEAKLTGSSASTSNHFRLQFNFNKLICLILQMDVSSQSTSHYFNCLLTRCAAMRMFHETKTSYLYNRSRIIEYANIYVLNLHLPITRNSVGDQTTEEVLGVDNEVTVAPTEFINYLMLHKKSNIAYYFKFYSLKYIQISTTYIYRQKNVSQHICQNNNYLFNPGLRKMLTE